MEATKPINIEYQRDIESAMLQAILKVGEVTEGGASAMLPREVVAACLNLIALATATSEATSTRQGRREFVVQVAARLERRIVGIQERAAEGKLDWMTTVRRRDKH